MNKNQLNKNIEKAARRLVETEGKTDKKKKYLNLTYGCQMNEHDSEKIAWVLETIGYEKTENMEEADFIIFNTCAVRDTSEARVLGKIGETKRHKRLRPDLIIAVAGCMSQREEMVDLLVGTYDQVDIILGTNNIDKLPQLINRYHETGEVVVDILEEHREVDENVEAHRLYDFKAFVNIIYGCNNFCSYCIVPYTRGREISREPENIIQEIKDLAANGLKEVTLLGQNVNSYGKTLDRDYNFTDLLEEINHIDGLEIIRFMTSHPKDISDELIKAYGRIDKLSNHLHLPVQSGSNRLLKLMNRGYTREDYMDKIKRIREINPNIAISTDIIVGYPGETEEDFQATLDLVKEVRYDSAFTFLYSKREGTPAAKSKEQIDDKTKHERFQRLIKTINPIALEKNQKYLGEEVEVLVDGVSKNDESVLTGRTRESKIVNLKADKSYIGKIVKVKIKEAKTFTLEGDILL